jgi:hypothetical protein
MSFNLAALLHFDWILKKFDLKNTIFLNVLTKQKKNKNYAKTAQLLGYWCPNYLKAHFNCFLKSTTADPTDRPYRMGHWHPQVKLSGRGPNMAFTSTWLGLNSELFVRSQTRGYLYQFLGGEIDGYKVPSTYTYNFSPSALQGTKKIKIETKLTIQFLSQNSSVHS